MRLIDADKLIKQLEEEIDVCREEPNGDIAYGCSLGLNWAIACTKMLIEDNTYESKEILNKCNKCINELKCKFNGIAKSNCKNYKRDAPDGGYYG